MVTVILNHAAGTKRDDDVRTRLADLFHAGRLPVEIIACEAGAAAGAALSAAKSGAEAVVAAGGDGTVSAVASALADSRTPLGVAHAGPVRVALDGEIVLMDTPLRYRVRPLALEVIVPDRDA